MKRNERILHLDICDYAKNKICSLYDNRSDISGQAHDIYITTERNGWRELSFVLPSSCYEDNQLVDNFRIDYLKAGYMIRAIEESGADWFIISEPKITHNAFSKSVNVVAGHVSQLLKMKNLGLEFSDDEGNNVGTAEELATTILAGTGWKVGYVYPFAERDGKTKYRSLKASSKTGAFKLIAMMCELFDAKPIYNGDERVVDIVPINPFSEPEAGMLPDIFTKPESENKFINEVLELYYGKNIRSIARSLNTDNIVTKMYAYGSYGDKTSGYCGIDECVHTEYTFTLNFACDKGESMYFTVTDDAGVDISYTFTPTEDLPAQCKLIFSLLDPSSMLYIWQDPNQDNPGRAYPVHKGKEGVELPASFSVDKEVKNWFQFVMNFDYYRSAGLLTDDMIQKIAEYQRTAPALYQAVSEASMSMSDALSVLSNTVGYIDFCKLDVDREESLLGDGYTTLILDKTTYDDGVIYRTDYDVSKANRFKWRVTDSLNTDGDPINTAAAIVYVIHKTNPITWDKAYLKALDDENNPSVLTLWSKSGTMRINADTDQFFLFSYNGLNGYIGTLESNDESAIMSLEDTLRVATVDHPVHFTTENAVSIAPPDENVGYAWVWKYKEDPSNVNSEIYFCNKDKGDTSWNYVYFQDSNPGGAEEHSYWYDWRNSALYHRESAEWVLLNTSIDQRVAEVFATVYMIGKSRDRYYKGVHEQYSYTVPKGATLPAGNYFFKNEYDSYWAFTTTDKLYPGDTLTYNYVKGWVTQKCNNIDTELKPRSYRFDSVFYHPSDIMFEKEWEIGNIKDDGTLEDTEDFCRTQSFISVVPNTEYTLSNSPVVQIYFYDGKKRWMKSFVSSDAKFTTPNGCTYIRICYKRPLNEMQENWHVGICATEANDLIVIEDLNYKLLNSIASGEKIGLIDCMSKFVEYADKTYIEEYTKLKQSQDAIVSYEQQMMESIGDLYREGWWQDASYVDGDEEKLYFDALDNLKHVSKPEATYNISYLDLFESNDSDAQFGAADETIDVKWPDVSISTAVHLVDPEIDVNTWAFMDKVQKCYDKPWQTKFTINTNLSTIAQHSFTDVMSNIATVASEVKNKTSYYDKTLQTSVSQSDINNVNVGMMRNEKNLLSTVERIEDIGGKLITHSSRISQTEDEISTEVSRAIDAENKLASRIIQTAEGITTEVTGLNNRMSIIQQKSDEISQAVFDENGKSIIKQTANEIYDAIEDVNGNMSEIVQTSNRIYQAVFDENGNSKFEQSADYIRAVVSGSMDFGGPEDNEFKTSSVSISKDGITMSTDGEFIVQAGEDAESSVVTVNNKGVSIGSSGKFIVQTENFGVSADGKVSATNAVINGQISNNGYAVLTKNYDVYIGTAEPVDTAHTGMLWIKPGTPSGGSSGSGNTNVPVNEEVTFYGVISKDHWFYDEGSANIELYADGYSTGMNSSYIYTISIPLHIRGRGTTGYQNGAIVKASLNGLISKSEEIKLSVSESQTTKDVELTMSVKSSVWLGDLPSITITISISRVSTDYLTGNFWLDADSKNNTISVTCTSVNS